MLSSLQIKDVDATSASVDTLQNKIEVKESYLVSTPRFCVAQSVSPD
jgi:hypothetical protein